MVETGVGNILAAVFQRTAGWRSPSMKSHEAGKIDHSFVCLLVWFPLSMKYDPQFVSTSSPLRFEIFRKARL
jgi:hypothetical protein